MEESLENSTVASESFMYEEEAYQTLPQKPGPQKRKREAELDNAHQIYGDSLLDYFLISGKDEASAHSLAPPQIPDGFQVDRPIDNHDHTPLHWAASMGDLDMVKYFIQLGANKHARNIRGETPLIRAVIFTNCYSKEIMTKMVQLLQETFQVKDKFGGTVFHHAATLTLSLIKKKAARYYLAILLNMFREMVPQEEFFRFLNAQDHRGDTALHIVARNNAKRCIRALQGHGVAGDIPNNENETADQILLASHRNHQYDLESSSPIQPTPAQTQPARLFTDSFATLIPDKSLQIMLALEQGVQEKVEDLAEANRILRGLNMEREQVRRETKNLIEHLKELEDDAALAAEEEMLFRESESLMEQIQHKTLHQEIRAEENQLSPLSHHGHSHSISNQNDSKNNNNNNNNDPNSSSSAAISAADTEALEQKYRASQRLAQSQQARRAAVREAVQAMATAGMTEKGETYQRLLVNALGVSAEEVMPMVPELLEFIEMAKMDADAENLPTGTGTGTTGTTRTTGNESAVAVLEDG